MRNERADQKLEQIRNAHTPYDISFAGVTVSVFAGVYPTSELSELVVECLRDTRLGLCSGNHVLDYGTGTGFLAIHAALLGAKVVATDINQAAVECAYSNIGKNGVRCSVDVRCGESFSSIQRGETFDIIVAGLPWDNAEARDFLEMSMYDAEFRMRRALFDNAVHVLRAGGRMFVTYSHSAQLRNPLEAIDTRYEYKTVRERSIKGEPHHVVMVTPRPTLL